MLSYDFILGLDFLCLVGINLLCVENHIQWGENFQVYQPCVVYSEGNLFAQTIKAFAHGDTKDNPEGLGYKSHHILDAKYKAVDTNDIAKQQTHLSLWQQQQLANLLAQFPRLFDGELRMYPHCKFQLDLADDAKPIHARAYSVPVASQEAFKKELEHLVKIGVLEPVGAMAWASPTFIIPKKDGCVRWISDFCALNKCIKRKVYPLPRISKLLAKRSGYQFFTKLDISMAYYTFELDDESKDLCTIAAPYGKFRYCALPLGVLQSPDFCQETMEHVLRDIGCFDSTWEQHLQTLERVLTRFQDYNLSINPRKCEWAVKQTDFLGYWLTPSGLKPWKKKIDAILRLAPPTTVKELCLFIGAVTYYWTMFPHRAHLLAPLTLLTSQQKGPIMIELLPY